MDRQANIAVIILTYNESRHLPRALVSIKGFAREIFVIDSFSTDDTVEIARAAGLRSCSTRSSARHNNSTGLSITRRSPQTGSCGSTRMKSLKATWRKKL